MMKIISKFGDWIVGKIGTIHWRTKKQISIEDREKIRDLITGHNLIILTRRSNHLSTYAIGFADFWLTRGRRFGYWSHVLMNLEDEVSEDKDFRIVEMNDVIDNTPRERELIEALGVGTVISAFDEVFVGIQSMAVLKPKHMTLEQWGKILTEAKMYLGRPYDTLFNLADDNQMSCVELVRQILRKQPNYEKEFANLERFIRKYKNLTPQMFYDCGDFEVVFEVRV